MTFVEYQQAHNLSLFPLEPQGELPVPHLDQFRDYLISADLADRACEYEDWEIQGSSAELSHLTHGFFRYFGKFPPPVAHRFIRELHDPQVGPVVDPMVGSGTTLVEAMVLKRAAIGLDVNPLACLVAKVKTTPLSPRKVDESLQEFVRFYQQQVSEDTNKYIPHDAHLDHWFFPETQQGLARTRLFIEEKIVDAEVQDFFRLTMASIIRRLSRASNGLGRMFLDPAIEPLDTQEHFVRKATQLLKGLNALELYTPDIQIMQHDAQAPFLEPNTTNLVICHPPYFNVYRYSSIYKFEMLWLGYNYPQTRKKEVREGFKIGKKELVYSYVEDMTKVFQNIHRVLIPGGRCVLMIGDTFLRGERINTTAQVVDRIMQDDLGFELERIIIRHPKYTEASYAATQRRTSSDIGVKLPDHVIVVRKALS